MSEWQRTVHLGKRDANEPAIRRVVEQEFGGSFEPHSAKDGPDAFVGLCGMTEPWEIKVSAGKVKPGQKCWAERWQGRACQVVRNEAQARKRLRMMRAEREREIARAVEAELERRAQPVTWDEAVDQAEAERLAELRTGKDTGAGPA